MKKIIYFLFLAIPFSTAFSQSVFWTENFGTGCSQGQFASAYTSTNGAWTEADLASSNPPFPNEWYVSATEAGMGVGICGDGCINTATLTNRTLHISSSLSDLGAAYGAGALCYTDKRVESPTINCTGKSSISMTFLYMQEGVTNVDYVRVVYYDGSTWSTINTPPKTANSSCGGQGLWTSYTVTLPASANNNANVKIGFRWHNNDPTGADPSVAIDDIQLLGNSSTFAPTFTMASSICAGNSVTVSANTGTFSVSGYTWSASPAGAVIASPNASSTAITFTSAGTYSVVLAATSGTSSGTYTNVITVNPNPAVMISTSNTLICSDLGQSAVLTASGSATNYSWSTGATTSTISVTPSVTTTYTLWATNSFSCTSQAVFTQSVTICSGINQVSMKTGLFTFYPNPTSDKLNIAFNSGLSVDVVIEIVDIIGKTISKQNKSFSSNHSVNSININHLPPGAYFIKMSLNDGNVIMQKIIKE